MQSDEAEPRKREVFFTHEFKRNVRQLAKKYKRIQKDIQPVIDDVQFGNLPGDQIPGITFEIFKTRARNTDSAKGKSGGYRIIYLRTESDTVVLLTIYSKTEQSDISVQEIRAIIDAYQEENRSKNEQEKSDENDEFSTGE